MDRMSEPSPDRDELLRRAFFTYLVGNPDAHAKNYSVVFRNGRISLASAYNINNAGAFRDCFKDVRARMAMAIGGCFDPFALTGGIWDAFARETGFTPARVRLDLEQLAQRMAKAAPEVADALRGGIEWSDRIDIAVADIVARCAAVPTMLERTSSPVEPNQVAGADNADEHIFSGP